MKSCLVPRVRPYKPMYSAYKPLIILHRPPPRRVEDGGMSGGFPHSEIPGSKGALASPGLIAECHVLHRLLPPRHPPNALIALDPSRKTTGDRPEGHPDAFPRPAWFFHHVPYERRDRPCSCELARTPSSTVSILDLERVDPWKGPAEA